MFRGSAGFRSIYLPGLITFLPGFFSSRIQESLYKNIIFCQGKILKGNIESFLWELDRVKILLLLIMRFLPIRIYQPGWIPARAVNEDFSGRERELEKARERERRFLDAVEKIKMCLRSFIVFGLLILVHGEVWGEDWKIYYETADGEFYYYDSESIAHPSRGHVKVSMKVVYSENARAYYVKSFGKQYKNLSHGIILSEINCFEKTVHSLSEQAFSKGGEVLYSTQKPGDWEIIIPGTNAEGLYHVLCK